jgi:hypothetical protein
MSDRTRKLTALHLRTDRDLVVLVDRELDRGLALADVAPSRCSPLFGQAEKALATAIALWNRIVQASTEDRARVERKQKELRFRLDQAPAFPKARTFPASFAS